MWRGEGLRPPHPEDRAAGARLEGRGGQPISGCPEIGIKISFETHRHCASKTRVNALMAMLLRMRPGEAVRRAR